MKLRRSSSKKSRAVQAVGTYLKFKAIQQAFKGARKGIKSLAAYKATKAAAKKAPAPVKVLPVVAGVGAAGAAGAVVVHKRRQKEEEPVAA